MSVAAAALCVPVAAQLHENIEVEGKYVPDIIKIDKIHTFPATESVDMETTPLPYEEEGAVADIPPYLVNMEATGWRASRKWIRNRGYVDFSLGSWLSSDLSAGYRFMDTDDTSAGIRLQFNSTSLWKPRLSSQTEEVRRELYDGMGGIYGCHHFSGLGYLDVSADWEAAWYNYYGYAGGAGGYIVAPDVKGDVKVPTQTYNEVSARVGWRSETEEVTMRWHAAIGVRHSAYRDLYLPMLSSALKGDRETMLYLKGGFLRPWDSGSSIGLDAEGNLLLYAGAGNAYHYLQGSTSRYDAVTFYRPDNYGQISLTPYYSFQRGRLNVRVGAELDFTFNAGIPGDRFGVFHIAPDVRLDYRKGAGAVYLHVGGGNKLQTLSSIRQLDYYALPALASTRPEYSPFDAVLGAGIGPFAGFSLEASVGYKISRGIAEGGWYQHMLNSGFTPLPGRETTSDTYLYSMDYSGMNIHGFNIRAKIDYKPLKILAIRAEGSYQPQKGAIGYFNGYDRPRLTAGISAEVTPVEKVRIYVGYDYRGVRGIYTQWHSQEGAPSDGGLKAGVKDKTHYESLRLPDLTLLNAGVNWEIIPAVALRVDAFNLLNRHDALLPGLPDMGINVSGGISVKF